MREGDAEPAVNDFGRSDLRGRLQQWSGKLELLRQNDLQSESRFLSFAKDRGISVLGVTKGDPGEFHRRRWLEADALDEEAQPLFHPFRIYPLLGILKSYRRPFAVSLDSHPERAAIFAAQMVESLPSTDQLEEHAPAWNEVADLAILLEPLYWPKVIGQVTRSGFVDEAEFGRELEGHRQEVLAFLAGLDVERWRREHESLRIEGAHADGNSDLYLLLRLSDWSKRKQLKGVVSLALWLRQMAELIRRGFEEAHEIEWPEEDEAFGFWAPDGRKLMYGSNRPLDDPAQARPRVVSNYRLQTGSIVRWYVEGTTEFHAIHFILRQPALLGIELVNLKGQIAAERDNAVLKLQDGLTQDLALKRFSMISFDTDVSANVKAIQRQVEENRVVGSLHPHTPDFEFANFGLRELVEIAAGVDEANEVPGDAVRQAEWSGIAGGRDFATRYCEASQREPRSLKGEEWGEALAAYAHEHPVRSDNGEERPFWRAIGNAMRCRFASYDLQKERHRFDPVTFAPVEVGPSEGGRASEDSTDKGAVDASIPVP